MKNSIGLLGLGSRTTSFYLDYLNHQYQQKNTIDSTCPLLLIGADFSMINPYLPNDFERLEPIIATYLKQFANVQRLIVPNVTLHETIDRLGDLDLSNCEIVHPVTELLKHLEQDGIKKVMLVGSKYTMSSPYLYGQLVANNINVSTPNASDITRIDELRKKIYSRTDSVSEVDEYRELLSTYAKANAVVIACTELSLVLSTVEPNIYDMARIQVEQSLL